MELKPQAGFEYEVKAAKVLKKYGIVPKEFRPAGPTGNKPDLILEHKKARSGCELKITTASAGSLILKYDINNKKNPWKFNEVKNNDKEKLFIHDLASEINLFSKIKQRWDNIPSKFISSNKKMIDKYKEDLKNFREINGEIPGNFIEGYYNKKMTYYINVGTHGFYMLGNKNPLNLDYVPVFAKNAKTMWRSRVQPKGGGNYQFIFEMYFSIPAMNRSYYNIAPIKGRNIKIREDELELSCFH